MKRIYVAVILAIAFSIGTAQPSHALGLKIAPLEYRTTLKNGESKKGFVDVSNPSGTTVTVEASVQAFKQIDNDGGLQFYNDKQINLGIKTDLSSFELGPHQALRMYFLINGKLLPPGDDYAAIFFTTQPKKPQNGVGQLVRVGTLLSIINGSPGQRQATVTGVSMPLVQFTDTVEGSYSTKNIGKAGTGFYPIVKIASSPGGKTRNIDSPLVFGGHERQNDFRLQTGFGLHYIEASYGNSKRGAWVLAIAPWMIVLAALILLIVGIELLLFRHRRKTRLAS